MIDIDPIRDAMWQARWDGFVVLGQAIWVTVLAHWWFAPLMLLALITTGRKRLLRLARGVGTAFLRANTD